MAEQEPQEQDNKKEEEVTLVVTPTSPSGLFIEEDTEDELQES